LFEIDPFIVQIVLGVLILWAVGINRLREMGVARGLRRAGA
jgi:ribose transport system permease protein